MPGAPRLAMGSMDSSARLTHRKFSRSKGSSFRHLNIVETVKVSTYNAASLIAIDVSRDKHAATGPVIASIVGVGFARVPHGLSLDLAAVGSIDSLALLTHSKRWATL